MYLTEPGALLHHDLRSHGGVDLAEIGVRAGLVEDALEGLAITELT